MAPQQKMAKLINVIKGDEVELDKRQLPLVIDEKLTMVLDLMEVDFMCEFPKLQGKEKEIFLKKFSMLNHDEKKEAFQVSCKHLLDIVSEIIPCVGCRRSVERLFHQMKTGPGRSGLYPLVVTPEGKLILPEEVLKWPNVIGAMFYNHIEKLNDLTTTLNRSKKSSRCSLHSLDAQRFVRPPLGSNWCNVWDCMVSFCKQEVATIDTAQLLSTLETYLQKHRFCTECRTKVMKAYSLLVDEPEECKGDCHADTTCSSSLCGKTCSTEIVEKHEENTQHSNTNNVKEKGFVPSLYAGIRRCSPNNHIHVDQRTDYIMGLILAAEPELLGNRRERHAKTLEIAQEEVLVCVGLCLYERLHRIQLRLREEQSTCHLLALVAMNALSTKFQLAVEIKQGISQLELLFQEFTREDRIKQKRKQARKLKRRRKKEKKITVAGPNSNSDENEEDDKTENNIENGEKYQKSLHGNADVHNINADCLGQSNDESDVENENSCNIKTFFRSGNDRFAHIVRDNELISKYSEKKDDSCYCSQYEGLSNRKKNNRTNSPLYGAEVKKAKKTSLLYYEPARNRLKEPAVPVKSTVKPEKNSKPIDVCRPVHDYSDTSSNNSSNSCNLYSKFQNNKDNCCGDNSATNAFVRSTPESSEPCDCCDGAQIDCGYSSADNNIISSNGSSDSSVDSSEVACSEGFCNHDGSEECNFEIRFVGCGDNLGAKKCGTNYDYKNLINSASQSLEQMLLTNKQLGHEGEPNNVDLCSGESCDIPVEEIRRFMSCKGMIDEQRKQLRKMLQSQFAQLCLEGKLDALSVS